MFSPDVGGNGNFRGRNSPKIPNTLPSPKYCQVGTIWQYSRRGHFKALDDVLPAYANTLGVHAEFASSKMTNRTKVQSPGRSVTISPRHDCRRQLSKRYIETIPLGTQDSCFLAGNTDFCRGLSTMAETKNAPSAFADQGAKIVGPQDHYDIPSIGVNQE